MFITDHIISDHLDWKTSDFCYWLSSIIKIWCITHFAFDLWDISARCRKWWTRCYKRLESMLVVWAALIGAKTFGKNLGKVPIEWLLMSLFLVVTWSSSSQLIHGMKVGSLVASLGVLFDYGKHHFIRRWTGITWPSHYQTWKNNVNYVTLLYIPWESDTYIIYICLYTYKYTYLYITHVYTHIYIYIHIMYIYIYHIPLNSMKTTVLDDFSH